VTGQALHDQGVSRYIVANEFTTDGLLEAIVNLEKK
jgi:uroporphyrinogen-III synthase